MLSGSSAGTARCAVITASTPAAIALRNGVQLHRFDSIAIGVQSRQRQMAVLGGVAVAGKMLGGHQHRILAIRMRAVDVGLHEAAPPAAGFSPNERMLMIGLSGLLLTSATGANNQLTPMARASRAVSAPSSVTPARSCAAAERHAVGPGRGGVHAHGSAALEIGRHEQRRSGHLLQPVEQRRHGVRFGIPHAAVERMPGDDDAAHVQIADQVLILPKLRRARVGELSIDGHDDQLRHLIAQAHGPRPLPDGRVNGLVGGFLRDLGVRGGARN